MEAFLEPQEAFTFSLSDELEVRDEEVNRERDIRIKPFLEGAHSQKKGNILFPQRYQRQARPFFHRDRKGKENSLWKGNME